MAELDALIKAGRGDERPMQHQRAVVYRKPRRVPRGSLKAARLERIAAEMRARYGRRRPTPIPPGTKCCSPGCERDAVVRERCQMHYKRDKRAGVLV